MYDLPTVRSFKIVPLLLVHFHFSAYQPLLVLLCWLAISQEEEQCCPDLYAWSPWWALRQRQFKCSWCCLASRHKWWPHNWKSEPAHRPHTCVWPLGSQPQWDGGGHASLCTGICELQWDQGRWCMICSWGHGEYVGDCPSYQTRSMSPNRCWFLFYNAPWWHSSWQRTLQRSFVWARLSWCHQVEELFASMIYYYLCFICMQISYHVNEFEYLI